MYILMAILIGTNVGFQAFNTQASCQNAAQTLQNANHQVVAQCVPQ